MGDVIYQPTDLAAKRTQFLRDARAGGARVRDKDGTSLVMLPESRLAFLEKVAEWGTASLRLEELLGRPAPPSITDLGDLAWLRVFDREDQHAFLEELHNALLVAHADQDANVLERCIHEWRVTAKQLEDPLRRSVLHGRVDQDDLVEVARPDGE